MVEIPTGRRDGKESMAANVRPNIIDTDFTLDQMIDAFSSKGLSIQDLVVLSGIYISMCFLRFLNQFRQNILLLLITFRSTHDWGIALQRIQWKV